jgi:hypothetical protein
MHIVDVLSGPALGCLCQLASPFNEAGSNSAASRAQPEQQQQQQQQQQQSLGQSQGLLHYQI